MTFSFFPDGITKNINIDQIKIQIDRNKVEKKQKKKKQHIIIVETQSSMQYFED